MAQEKEHKRRVRYSGTHPTKYSEKYKELQPEKYADTISKVIQKGSTPAGMHISICYRFSRDKKDWIQRWAMADILWRC